MIGKASGMLALLLVPAAALYATGNSAAAHWFVLGAVLAMQMSLLARPVAGFALLLPVIYAAAAITAQSTGGVVALILAAAGLVGAASSQGVQRGVLAVLAATLIGSAEPASPSAVLEPMLVMLAGSAYGLLLALTLLRNVDMDTRAVRAQTALSFAALLAVLVTIAWLAAKAFGVEHGWWIPLAVAAVGQPAIEKSVLRSILYLAGALCTTLAMVAGFEFATGLAAQVTLLVIVALLMLVVGQGRRWVRALLLTPFLMLVVGHQLDHAAPLDYLRSAFMACSVVFAFALLGQWMLWTIRPDPGCIPARAEARRR
ncbi:MAG: hypothetical protein MUO39_07590 [Steroidobacteraceae bacterium]|nr:hypothetical protein [Steroidobacteraceae bacterium]